jgi:hypothetical protein
MDGRRSGDELGESSGAISDVVSQPSKIVQRVMDATAETETILGLVP